MGLVTIGLVWKFLLDPNIGFVGGIFDLLGIPPVSWLTSTSLALPTVIFVNIWKNLGFAMILLTLSLWVWLGRRGLDRTPRAGDGSRLLARLQRSRSRSGRS